MIFDWSMQQTQGVREHFPSLCEFAGVEESVQALRQRWYGLFLGAYVEFVVLRSGYRTHYDAAEALVEERVGQHLDECFAEDIEEFHEWVFVRLCDDRYFAAKLGA